MQTQLLFNAQATLGEGPAWDEKTQSLYWVDIPQKKIYCGVEPLAELDATVGCLAPSANGNLILGLGRGVATFEILSRRAHSLAALDEPRNNRVNDGKCDPAGRFLFGTMDMLERDASGALYSFNGENVTRLLSGIRISNGLAWSPDYKTFYYIDTPTRQVQAFDYDLASGSLSNPRIAIRMPESFGFPDGMTSDSQGCLWVACWGGAQVTRWNPNTGELLERVPVPALHTSACVFGGKKRNELYVTSARAGMSAADLKKYPLSGGLFKVETKFEGIETFAFNPITSSPAA
ncbi:MAG: SMP-30/gluconolactonase/LRE family protein [Anaerolineales bacterium]